MNVAKNMEAIFIVALALAGATGFATAAVPALHAARASVTVADNSPMPTVVVTAKRLTAEQKAAI